MIIEILTVFEKYNDWRMPNGFYTYDYPQKILHIQTYHSDRYFMGKSWDENEEYSEVYEIYDFETRFSSTHQPWNKECLKNGEK